MCTDNTSMINKKPAKFLLPNVKLLPNSTLAKQDSLMYLYTAKKIYWNSFINQVSVDKWVVITKWDQISSIQLSIYPNGTLLTWQQMPDVQIQLKF